ncbi:helix-turn-helix domain-containing protein [Halomarina salina]|uniref:Helix-turn-helix domain-containing protein n=1 Tax=Halomarina salina TaxID=1872699 RepID=A0ABD5RTJ4_9EURY|nr:helix-turn-helix domain-containing protein [Halomarina salina]
MSVVSTVSVPPGEFRLGWALSVGDARIELERTVQEESPLAVWVWTDDADAYLDALADRGVEHVTCEERVDGGLRCSVDAAAGTGPELLDAFEEAGLTLLSGAGDDRVWRFRVRAANSRDLTQFRRLASERAIPIEINRQAGATPGSVGGALTAIQRETLVAAYEQGYYSTPRTATLADLGERFDISPRAVSQRLRRGVGNLVEATLWVD